MNKKYKTLIVPKETVIDKWFLPFEYNQEEGIEILKDEIVDHTRWSVIHDMIVRIKDKVYSVGYSVGATEYQDEDPWGYVENIIFTEVEEKEVLVKQWVPIELDEYE